MPDARVVDSLKIGRKSRPIPTAIGRALRHRDGGCCHFRRCANRPFVEDHHIVHWADGGDPRWPKITLCSRHHGFVHEHGYRMTMPVGSAEPQVLDDRGRETKHVPPALPSRDDLHASNDYFAINAERNLFALAWKRGRLRRLHREIDVLLMIRPYT